MITLLPEELSLLKHLVSKYPLTGPNGWITKKLEEKLLAQEEEWKKRKECKHSPAEYITKEKCCSICGAYDVGQGFSRAMVNPQLSNPDGDIV